jgi:hypothetical protein
MNSSSFAVSSFRSFFSFSFCPFSFVMISCFYVRGAFGLLLPVGRIEDTEAAP